MNGIIHNCSHPNDNDVHFRITEEQIFRDIFFYLETLFDMIKPQKLFFMAVDGVAVRFRETGWNLVENLKISLFSVISREQR
jgi:5'-3' exonuclease